mgnify:CR=1 FL=1
MIRKLFFVFSLLILISDVKAQDVKLLTIDQLESRFKNGKDTVYVINFWATWCAPCVAELPHFEKLQATYKTQLLKVLLVSLDYKSKLQNVVKPFIKRNKLTNEVFLLNEKNQQAYIDRISREWSGALPATLIVNYQKDIHKLFEQAFSYSELEKAYKLLN